MIRTFSSWMGSIYSSSFLLYKRLLLLLFPLRKVHIILYIMRMTTCRNSQRHYYSHPRLSSLFQLFYEQKAQDAIPAHTMHRSICTVTAGVHHAVDFLVSRLINCISDSARLRTQRFPSINDVLDS